MRASYDKKTDTLTLHLRESVAVNSREIDEDVVLDLGADGRPVAYEIQFASARHELVGRLMLEALKQADSGTTHTTHMIPPPLAGEVKEGDGAVRSVAG